jgi:retinol dehydrogenase 12
MSATGDERRGEHPSPMYAASADDVSTSASLRGRVCVVTGASRGIGQATSRALARCGAIVVMIGRDRASLSHAVEQVEGDAVRAGGSAVSLVADLASLTAIRAVAREIARRFSAVHALVNNAGVSVPRRRTSEDGIELTFAVNVLAPFVLTQELLPALRRGAPSRVVNVTSLFARLASIDFDDLEGARRYSGDRAYLQSKLALVLLTQRFAERVRGTGVTPLCVDPGLAVTDLLRERWWWRARWLRPLWNRLFLTPEEAARGTVMAVASPALADAGGRWVDRRGRDVHLRSRWRDPAIAERLWRACEHLTNGR